MRWLLARTAPLLALGALLLATGCGQLSPEPSSTADDQPSVLGPPSPASSPVDVAPTGTVDVVDPEDTASKPLGMSAFEDAMAAY